MLTGPDADRLIAEVLDSVILDYTDGTTPGTILITPDSGGVCYGLHTDYDPSGAYGTEIQITEEDRENWV